MQDAHPQELCARLTSGHDEQCTGKAIIEKRESFARNQIIKGTSLVCITDNVFNASFADYFDILYFFTNPGGMSRQNITL